IFCARALHLCFAHPNEGWAERRETFGCDAPAVRAMTRHARRLRGAMRPLRAARLLALRHRGDFGLRGRACLTGICAGSVTASSSHPGRSAWRAGSLPPETNGYEPPPQDATPRSAFRIVSSSLLKNPRQNESSVIQFFNHESVEARMRGAFTDQGQLF